MRVHLSATALKKGAIQFALPVVRGAERVLPLALLGAFLRPAAAVWSFCELVKFRPRAMEFERLPTGWVRGKSAAGRFVRLWVERTHLNSTKALSLIPDRLHTPRWRGRIVARPAGAIESIRTAGRPVILATLHFGPMALLLHWLRSLGVPAAAIADRKRPSPRFRLRLNEHVDREMNLEGVPRLFLVDQIWDIAEFLRDDRVLQVAIDGDRGRWMDVDGAEISLRFATGLLKLSSISGADIIPCLLVARAGLRVEIHLGTPIAAATLGSRSEFAKALGSMLAEFELGLRSHPEQCSWELLRRISVVKRSPARCVGEDS